MQNQPQFRKKGSFRKAKAMVINMKLKAIEKLCKAAGSVRLLDEAPKEDVDGTKLEPRQWMSDGVAAYPLDGLPYLDEESVCAIFDVDAKKRDKLVITHHPSLPGGVDFGDLHPGDSPLEPLNFQMSLGGDELYLLRDKDGALVVIKSCYRKPFDAWKECECYKRIDTSGEPYVAVIHGCVLRGIVYPYKIGDTLVETLGAVYNAAGVAADQEQLHM